MWRLVLLALCCCSEARQSLRVHAGLEDVHNEFPFAVSLQAHRGRRFCTGSLIARNWVLTAGHCIDGGIFRIKHKNFTTKHRRGTVAKVFKVILHPGFLNIEFKNALFLHYDMALIQTAPIHNKTIGKLSAINYKALIGLPVKYAGFGGTAEDSNEILDDADDEYRPLQVGEAVVISQPEFNAGPNIIIAPKCSQKEQGIRGGDSGGPLIYNGKIVGLAMASLSDRNIAWYAPVSTALEWIHHTLNAYGYIL